MTVHSREEAVLLSSEEYRRLKSGPTGQVLIDAFRDSPLPEIDIAPERFMMPVRDVEL
jgi:hypothetical protein